MIRGSLLIYFALGASSSLGQIQLFPQLPGDYGSERDLSDGSYPDADDDHYFPEYGEAAPPPEDEGDYFPGGEFENTSSGPQLALTGDEIRSETNHGVYISLGNAVPWMSLAGQSIHFLSPNTAMLTSFGVGRLQLNGNLDSSVSYRMDLVARGFGTGLRYYFDKFPWLALDGLMGYSFWSGQVQPHGQSELVTLLPGDLVDSKFEAHGGWVGTRATVSTMWRSGLAVEWVVFGAQKSFLASYDLTQESKDGENTVRDNLATPHFFGFTNLSLGYFF